MHEMTAGHLRSAYGGEAMAHMRYLVWGGKAKTDGYPNVARLFLAISHAEHIHAMNHFTELRDEAGAFLVASGGQFGFCATAQNLQGAIGGENFEVAEMYPVYLEAAKLQQEKGPERSFRYALSAERIHAAMFEEARQSVAAEKDIELGPVRVCNVCGHTAEGEIPERCPVCGARAEMFDSFE